MVLVLARAMTYAALFIGLLLIFLPARVLASSGIRGPAGFGVLQIGGLVLGAVGATLAVWCVVTFAIVGHGTPAPFDPPRRLVIRGPYRVVRNPMYWGAGLALTAAALYYQSAGLLAYTIGFLLAAHLLVIWYEEPTLRRTFGADYDAYRQRVSRWWPRLPGSTPSTRRYALACLLGGLALALATPAYVAYAAPHLAGYLLHPALFLLQAVPYVVCGALWLPWRRPEARTPALVLSLLLLVAAVIVYLPIIRVPGAGGGDMVAFAYVEISVVMTVGVLLASGVTLLIMRLGRPR
jgi:protein-S-isoprenylcysteine O-methyltransferase Ste14